MARWDPCVESHDALGRDDGGEGCQNHIAFVVIVAVVEIQGRSGTAALAFVAVGIAEIDLQLVSSVVVAGIAFDFDQQALADSLVDSRQEAFEDQCLEVVGVVVVSDQDR